MTWRNADVPLFISKPGAVQILQDFYPETLRTCLILHPGWIFSVVWKVIGPFLVSSL